MLYCFEKKGVLMDCDDEGSVIPSLKPSDFERLKKDGVIAEGMIPKLENSFNALRSGASGVTIKHSDDLLKPDAGTKLSL